MSYLQEIGNIVVYVFSFTKIINQKTGDLSRLFLFRLSLLIYLSGITEMRTARTRRRLEKEPDLASKFSQVTSESQVSSS